MPEEERPSSSTSASASSEALANPSTPSCPPEGQQGSSPPDGAAPKGRAGNKSFRPYGPENEDIGTFSETPLRKSTE